MKLKIKNGFYYLYSICVLFLSSCESNNTDQINSNVYYNVDSLNSEKLRLRTFGYYFHQFKTHYNDECRFDKVSSQDSFVFNEKFIFKARNMGGVKSNLIVGRDSFGNVCSVKFLANEHVMFDLNIFFDSLLNSSLGLLNTYGYLQGTGLFFVENERLYYLFKDRYNLNGLNSIAGIMALNESFEVINEVKISDNEMLYYGLINYSRNKPRSTSIFIPHHAKKISKNYPISSLIDTLEMREYFDYCGELLITSKSPECYLPLWIWQGNQSILYDQFKK